MIIAIDFDGTIVEHEFPKIGKPVPGAIDWIKRFQENGAKIILWTVRSSKYLDDAVQYCKDNGVELWGINANPTQAEWADGPKVYAYIYIDDAAFGCPLIHGYSSRPFIDWNIVGPAIMDIMGGKQANV